MEYIRKYLRHIRYSAGRGKGVGWEVLREDPAAWQAVGGVAHSFTGTEAELAALLDLGLHIGVNGCSLKTEENLATVAKIPRDRVLLETDCPYCDCKATHASARLVRTQPDAVKKPEKYEDGKQVKGRNEPANVVQVAEVLDALLGEGAREAATANALRLFPAMAGEGPAKA